jgi:hypothetical protein
MRQVTKTHSHPDGSFTIQVNIEGNIHTHTGKASYLRKLLQNRYRIFSW